MPWWGYALIAALSAGLVSVLGKVGLAGVDSSLATAVRSVVMMGFTVGFVALRGNLADVSKIPSRTLLFIVLSGAAGALSWLAGFAALQKGTATQVSTIDRLSVVVTVVVAVLFLGERLNRWGALGVLLIVAGSYMVARGVTKT